MQILKFGLLSKRHSYYPLKNLQKLVEARLQMWSN